MNAILVIPHLSLHIPNVLTQILPVDHVKRLPSPSILLINIAMDTHLAIHIMDFLALMQIHQKKFASFLRRHLFLVNYHLVL